MNSKPAGCFLHHCGRIGFAALLLISLPAAATTKGLSQIVTPDIQPESNLSLSFQVQSKQIGNPYQIQEELGLTKWLEVAASEGLSPGEGIFGMEAALVQREPYLLSVGFINWSTRGHNGQPFLEGGYYTEHDKFMGGPIRVGDHTRTLLGWAHDFNPMWRFQLDYESGRDNFSTIGFTCNATPNFQFNPAVYFTNGGPNHTYGYLVLTYTFPVWVAAQAP